MPRHRRVPSLRGESGVEHHLGDAQRPRTDDAIARASDPPRVRGAPVDVVVLEIEHDLGREVLGNDARVDVQSPLGFTGRAAGVVHQARAFGEGVAHREIVDGAVHHVKGDLSVAQRLVAVALVDDDHQSEVRQIGARAAHARQVLALGDHGRGAAVLQARAQGLVAKGGEQRLHHRAELEDPHEADVQLRNAVEEKANPIQLADALLFQKPGPAVAQPLHVAEGESSHLSGVVLVDQGRFVAAPQLDVAVGADPPDVDWLTVYVAQLFLGGSPVDSISHPGVLSPPYRGLPHGKAPVYHCGRGGPHPVQSTISAPSPSASPAARGGAAFTQWSSQPADSHSMCITDSRAR